MPAPLVSVLVPAWNAGRSIPRALDSLLADGEANLQVVVVDDASTDDTIAVVEAIAARDPRVELVRSPVNGGPSAARNLGLPLLRGEWMTFLDADDRLLPGALDAFLHAATTTDALAVIGQRIWSDGTRTWITKTYDQPDIRVPGRKSVLTHPGLLFYASGTGKLSTARSSRGSRSRGASSAISPGRSARCCGPATGSRSSRTTSTSGPGRHRAARNSSITSRKHDSAALAAEAVLVAIDAWTSVHDEAVRVLPDPAHQERIGAAYAERLMRSDFSGPVDRALEARDPGMDRLFEALLAFVHAVPGRRSRARRRWRRSSARRSGAGTG